MNLRAGLDKIKFDIRMQELNIRNGSISQEELKKQLNQLPDSENEAIEYKVEVGFEPSSQDEQ